MVSYDLHEHVYPRCLYYKHFLESMFGDVIKQIQLCLDKTIYLGKFMFNIIVFD